MSNLIKIDEFPYFVRRTARGSHLPHGWATEVIGDYRTLEEARAALEGKFPAFVVEGEVYRWETEDEMRAAGRQRRSYYKVLSRKRKQPVREHAKKIKPFVRGWDDRDD